MRSRTSGRWPAAASSSHRSAVRRSCQTIARCSGRPVRPAPRDHRLALVGDADGGDRLVEPCRTARPASPAPRPRSRWRRARPSPGRGKCCVNSRYDQPRICRRLVHGEARTPVVPASMAITIPMARREGRPLELRSGVAPVAGVGAAGSRPAWLRGASAGGRLRRRGGAGASACVGSLGPGSNVGGFHPNFTMIDGDADVERTAGHDAGGQAGQAGAAEERERHQGDAGVDEERHQQPLPRYGSCRVPSHVTSMEQPFPGAGVARRPRSPGTERPGGAGPGRGAPGRSVGQYVRGLLAWLACEWACSRVGATARGSTR